MRRQNILFFAFLGLLALVAMFTTVGFMPVPWPDASAFYLAGVDLVNWPPRWLMRSQAGFVPSYNFYNFNAMPALPFILGLDARIGLGRWLPASEACRWISLVAWAVWSWLIWRAAARRAGMKVAWIVAAAAAIDPVIRWGTLVVRTETWIGMIWAWMLLERDRLTPWKTALALTLMAAFHFESVYLVPAAAILLFPWDAAPEARLKLWWQRLWGVGWRTTVLLSPWLLYALVNFDVLLAQMAIQFKRLAHQNPYTTNVYGLFHSFFLQYGSPIPWPKLLNVAKVFFWALSLIGIGCTAMRRERGPVLAGAVAYVAMAVLWITKPETWFTTMIHLAFWPWMVTLVAQAEGQWRRALVGSIGVIAVFHLATTAKVGADVPREYNWRAFHDWVDCIDKTLIEEARGNERALKLWQPFVPDALTDLRPRHPSWEMTRSLDFVSESSRAHAHGYEVDALLFSNHSSDRADIGDHTGDARPEDLDRLSGEGRHPGVAFGTFIIEQLRNPATSRLWKLRICQRGPFWGALGIKEP